MRGRGEGGESGNGEGKRKEIKGNESVRGDEGTGGRKEKGREWKGG